MKTYPPKRDAFIAGSLLLAPAIMIVILLIEFDVERLLNTVNGWISLSVCVLMSGFLLWLWFGTRYRMDNSKLHVACGPIRKTIALADIRYVRPGRSLQSAYALALQRLHIGVQNGRVVDELIIAPADTKRFLQDLQRMQPDAVIHGGLS